MTCSSAPSNALPLSRISLAPSPVSAFNVLSLESLLLKLEVPVVNDYATAYAPVKSHKSLIRCRYQPSLSVSFSSFGLWRQVYNTLKMPETLQIAFPGYRPECHRNPIRTCSATSGSFSNCRIRFSDTVAKMQAYVWPAFTIGALSKRTNVCKYHDNSRCIFRGPLSVREELGTGQGSFCRHEARAILPELESHQKVKTLIALQNIGSLRDCGFGLALRLLRSCRCWTSHTFLLSCWGQSRLAEVSKAPCSCKATPNAS